MAPYSLARAARFAALLALGAILSPAAAFACACGCGVFDVATGSLFTGGQGTTLFAEYDFMNQHINWSGTSKAPSANNDDKKIRTDFLTLGAQYMINRDWGVMAEVPVWNRHFDTASSGTLQSFDHAALGDIRLRGVYTGFSDDQSTGVTFGVKVPSGDSGYANFDDDTEIGTGSTDLLLGVYHQGALDADANWIWYGQVSFDVPVMHKSGYRPGAEADTAIGTYYNSWYVGKESKIAPVLQLIASHRERDGGANSNPGDSGYDRLLIAPGIEFDTGAVKLYADVEVPVYQDMRGNQLTAPALFKLIASYAL